MTPWNDLYHLFLIKQSGLSCRKAVSFREEQISAFQFFMTVLRVN